MQYQQSPLPRLACFAIARICIEFPTKSLRIFCPNFNGRPGSGTTSQSHSLDSADEDDDDDDVDGDDDEEEKKRKTVQ